MIMSKKRSQITVEETDEMFGGDILDRVTVTRDRHAPGSDPPSAAIEPEDPDDSKPIKVSLYLKPEAINALDEVIMQRRLQDGSSPRRTHLIREAIELWLEAQEV